MPSVSKAQHSAMEAAAEGDSKLGIPKKVGKEFVEADTRGKSYSKAKPHKARGRELSKRLGVLPAKR
jgi:hypothetical protein